MKKQFLNKILKYGKVETKKYLYVIEHLSNNSNQLVIRQYDNNSYYKGSSRIVKYL